MSEDYEVVGMTRRVSVEKYEREANAEIKRRESDGWELVDQDLCPREVHEHAAYDDEYYVMLVFEKDEGEGGESE